MHNRARKSELRQFRQLKKAAGGSGGEGGPSDRLPTVIIYGDYSRQLKEGPPVSLMTLSTHLEIKTEIVAQTTDPQHFITLLRRFRPALALLNMEGTINFNFVKQVQAELGTCKLLLLTNQDVYDTYLEELIANGLRHIVFIKDGSLPETMLVLLPMMEKIGL